MQEKYQSILTIIKCVGVILQIRRQLGKQFSKVTKEDVKSLFRWMDDKCFMIETHEKFRAVLKKFYKIVYGNNQYYTDFKRKNRRKKIKNNLIRSIATAVDFEYFSVKESKRISICG